MLASCQQSKYPGFKETKTGLYYKLATDVDDTLFPKLGDFVEIDMKYGTKDSIIFDSKNLEEQFINSYPGHVMGKSSIFTASLIQELATQDDVDIKAAQCEEALFLLQNADMEDLLGYREMGADYIKIGDVSVSFGTSTHSKLVISPKAKKLISRWIRKRLRVGRA